MKKIRSIGRALRRGNLVASIESATGWLVLTRKSTQGNDAVYQTLNTKNIEA